MTSRVDPKVKEEVQRFGARDLSLCFNCGTCTATCPLSAEGPSFPRKIIHLLQVGLREELLSSPEPWLCYYCGECSTSCPREANPGETMMSARRWLIASYDWTGISRKIYTSRVWEWGLIAAASLLVVLLFVLFHGPIVTDRVALNTFAPVEWISLADHVAALFALSILGTNALRMARSILGKNGVSPLAFVRALPVFFVNLFTQKRWRECGESRREWILHLLLVASYVGMMVIIIFFLSWFQTDEIHPFFHPQRLVGYAIAAVMMVVPILFMRGRVRRDKEIHRFSHPTDWTFLILLFLIALTGILVHVFRISGMPEATYAAYVIHLAVDAPWVLVIVPFGKWTHIVYRPFALYLLAVKEYSLREAVEGQPETA